MAELPSPFGRELYSLVVEIASKEIKKN